MVGGIARWFLGGNQVETWQREVEYSMKCRSLISKGGKFD